MSSSCIKIINKTNQPEKFKCVSYWYVTFSKDSPKEKFNICQKECKKGNLKACANLSYLYRTGIGVEKDYKKALEIAKSLCKRGVALACANLGGIYYYGQGVKRDVEKAMELLKKACDMNEPLGCNGVVLIHMEEEKAKGKEFWVTKKSLPYIKKSCSLGDASGCFTLGLYYYIWESNTNKYEKYMTKGCFNGFASACEVLAGDYMERITNILKSSNPDKKKLEEYLKKYELYRAKVCELKENCKYPPKEFLENKK
jgi:hypothetical protein